MTTTKLNNRQVKVSIPSKSDEEVNWYIDKYNSKMADSIPSTAAWWIDGANLTPEQSREVWDGIQNNIDRKSRDRQFEHGDMPAWYR